METHSLEFSWSVGIVGVYEVFHETRTAPIKGGGAGRKYDVTAQFIENGDLVQSLYTAVT